MAVVVTVAKGYDLAYIWKTRGEAAGRATGGYYINAAQAGEPPGRWWGPGAQALGLTPGQIVQRKPYEAVYQQLDPRTGARLGRSRGRYTTFAEHLARLRTADPHATTERLIELEREAALIHLAAVVSYAARNGCKLVLAGDQEQLAAVEGGGAMTLLADRLGYVQLAEPVRFTAAWERGASLRLRSGDATALDEYDQHGRIRGAPPDQAMDQAVRAYVASYLDGRDVLLMAADWARCRELSARIRDNLIQLGLVDNGRTVRIAEGAEGAEASVGDLIICRRNDHAVEAGAPGRALANGDVLRIEAITPGGIIVRRQFDPDRATGQRRFTDRAFRYPGYQSADLAYAITGHSAQGATVHTGIALVTGTENRQWLYPAMTRGTDTNLAFVFTTPPRSADPQPGRTCAPWRPSSARTATTCRTGRRAFRCPCWPT